jgi:anti-sigma B factor antagonist
MDARPDLGSTVSEGTPVANETELLAWVLLRAANRQQAKGSTVRLVVPSAPEVAYEVGVELPEARLLEVEEYLQDHGYIEPLDIGLTRGTYTITPAGLEYLDMGASKPLEAPREETTELSERAEPRLSTARLATRGTREDTEKRPPLRTQEGDIYISRESTFDHSPAACTVRVRSAASAIARHQSLGEIGGLQSAELRPAGRLDIEFADDFQETFSRMLESGVTQFFVDLREVSYVDSSGLGSLMRLHREAKSRGGRTWFYDLTPPVREIFSLTHLNKVIELYGTRQEAFTLAGKIDPPKSGFHEHLTEDAPEHTPADASWHEKAVQEEKVTGLTLEERSEERSWWRRMFGG